MSDRKRTRPGTGIPRRAELGAETGQATTSMFNDTMSSGSSQTKIADLLSHGAENGLHLSDLVRLTDLPERTVRQMIHQERRRHIPVLSDNKNGYFLPGSDREKADCVQSLRRRAAEILEAADGIDGVD